MVKELRLALRPFLISFFAHPTKSTAAIVVSRRCFMSSKAQLNCVLFAIVLNVHMKIFMQYKKGQYAHA